jgi:ribosome-associated toxin RatA of RatAB toxin-antitoxin module
MADKTSSSIVIDAPAEQIMDVIADFPAYPQWAPGMHVAEVRSSFPDGRAEVVYFEIEATPIKDAYSLKYVWHGDLRVDWTLVDGKMLRGLDGSYILDALGSGTKVTYQLAVDLSIPMIGMLRRKAEKVIIDTALKGLKKRVESLPAT